MTKLPKALLAWNTDKFDLTLRDELQELSTGTLPLVQATTQGGHIDDRHMTIIFLHATDVGIAIQATIGVFFTEIVPSCGCPIEPIEEERYCEMQIMIEKFSSMVKFVLIQD
jgi:hypothetical protein